MDTLSRIQDVFRDVFHDPALVVTPQTTARDIPDWDSLTNIGLIIAIEQEFHVKFALGEIQELKNVGAMAELIQQRQLKTALA
jgi:acyl carrier protein